jgi:nucleotide-binding universal stress UspA family protein
MDVDIDRKLDGRSVMVIGVDFSETSHQAVAVALNLARITRAPDLHLIHVLKHAPMTGLSDWSGAISQYEKAVDSARRELDLICASAILKFDLRAFAHVRTGEPHREIVQLASDIEADLVVIGTHSRAGVTRLLLGSVAEKVQRQAPCPVLTVKPKERPRSSDLEPPCPLCHELRIESRGARLWCVQHVNTAKSFFPPSQPPPFDGATWEEEPSFGTHRGGA